MPLRHVFPERAAFPFHLRRVPLAGMERLFFNGSFSRINSRHIMLGLAPILLSCSTVSHNSFKVASGWAFTAARITFSAGANLRATPPAWGSGATPRGPLAGQPTFDGRFTHPEPFRSLRNGAFAALDTQHDSFAKVCRIRLHTADYIINPLGIRSR